jgi:predicted phage terminase large subunit-like protein
VSDAEIFRDLLQGDFSLFTRRAILHLAPNLDLQWNWHLDVMSDHLRRLADGDIQRLIINVPPRSLKSLMCTVSFPAWLLGLNPYLEILCASYAQSLGEDFSRQTRRLMESEFYRLVFDTRLSPAKRAVDQFETSLGGGRITTSVGGSVTGRGGDVIILDDPTKPEDAMSESGRKSTNDWLSTTLASRPNSKKNARVLVIMQRLHEADVTAELLAQGGWTHLSLPAIATQREEHRYRTISGPEVHIREPGDLLHPEREGIEEIERARIAMGGIPFAAQMQQHPEPLEGNLLKRDWIRFYVPEELREPQFFIQSWDTASKTGQLNDYSVCTTWAVTEKGIYLVDVFRARLEMPELQRKVIELADRFRPERVLIEEHGSGIGLLQGLTAAYFYNALPIKPQGDKLFRFSGVTPMFEAGKVYLPKQEPWLDAYLTELCGFPSAKHDDQVDSTSQALIWLRERTTMPGIIEFYRQEVEKKRAYRENRTVHLRAPPGVNVVHPSGEWPQSVGPDGTIWVTGQVASSLLGNGFERLE